MLGTEVAMGRSWMVLSVVGVAVLASACGGAEFNSVGDDGGGGGNDAANPSDASGSNDGGMPNDGGGQPDVHPPPQDGGTWSPICPMHQPSAGTSCAMEGLQCEYGNVDPDPACSTIMQCTNGTFQPSTQYGTCMKQPNGSECASSFASVPRGAVCSPNGATCDYELGDCRCEVMLFGPPLLDASVQPKWDCDDPGPGCPTPRARLGSACTMNGQSCMYRPCSFGEQCMNGYWQPELIACAGTP
jgi:hypothetical protein